MGSQSYKKTTQKINRSHRYLGTIGLGYTIAYRQGESCNCYGQIEEFFVVRDDLRMTCGAVVSPLTVSSQHVCNIHEVLESLVTHKCFVSFVLASHSFCKNHHVETLWGDISK